MGYFRCEDIENKGNVTAFYTGADVKIRKGCTEDIAVCCRDFGFDFERAAITKQKHTTNIDIVDEDYLAGIRRGNQNGERGVDGLLTDVPGVLLCTYEADCVPVYFYDPVKRVAGMVHSGWRGTADCISEKAAGMMKDRFGCRAEDICVFLGPHICGECYEVGGELITEFEKNFGYAAAGFFVKKSDEKYLLNMSAAIRFCLERAGIPGENITESGRCTFSEEAFCSYRRTGEKTERMLTAIGLNPLK